MGRRNKKYTTEEVNEIVRQRGYEVDPEFVWVSSLYPVSFICPKHGRIQMQLNNLRRAQCKQCSIEQETSRRLAKSNVKENLLKLLKERNFELVEMPELIKSSTKLKVRCRLDQYEWTTSWNRLSQQTHGCARCSRVETLKFSEVKAKIEARGFTILSEDEPVGFTQTTFLDVMCQNGHKTTMTGNRINHPDNYGCKYCAGKALTQEEVMFRLAERGFVTNDVYVDVRTPLNLICKNGHTLTKSYMAIWHDKTNCPQCDPPYTSRSENELAEWLKTLIPDNEIKRNDRELLHGSEIDIYIPSRKFGIEFNGLYYHNEIFLMEQGKSQAEAQSYHFSKFVRARNAGVQLITIWDYEWEIRKQAIQTRLKSLLGLNPIRIGARKTTVRAMQETERTQVMDFIETYHVQGSTAYKYAYGLFYGTDIVSVMTFHIPHRQNMKKDHLILNRYCVREDHTISGGAQKLFQFAVKELNCPIISYSDNRWSLGNIYRILGFNQERVLRPDYLYTRNGKYFSKQSLKKTEEEKGLDKTERELRLEQKYYRVWDCGKITWVYEKSPDGSHQGF